MENIYLIGTGNHAKVIADILSCQKRLLFGIFDENEDAEGFLNFVVSPLILDYLPANGYYIIAIIDNYSRKELVESYQKHIVFTNAVHPRSVISIYAQMALGTVVMSGAVVDIEASVGKHVILNTNCVVGSGCVIGDYAHIGIGAVLEGDVRVGEGSHIATGAYVAANVQIGEWCMISAGSRVFQDIPNGESV